MRPISLLALAALCGLALSAPAGAQTAATADAATLGSSKRTAVEVCMPPGERNYIRRLRCGDGAVPDFQRVGSVGMRDEVPPRNEGETDDAHLARLHALMDSGEQDFHIIDLSALRCGDATHELYMDMYHCGSAPPAQAPVGFTYAPE